MSLVQIESAAGGIACTVFGESTQPLESGAANTGPQYANNPKQSAPDEDAEGLKPAPGKDFGALAPQKRNFDTHLMPWTATIAGLTGNVKKRKHAKLSTLAGVLTICFEFPHPPRP